MSAAGVSEPGIAARRVALQAITRVEEDDAYSTHVIPQLVDGLEDARERRFASHLAYDTLRWAGTLDWMLGHTLTRPLDHVEDGLLRVLRMGTLQIWRMRLPDRAAVSTSVELARFAVPRKRSEGAAKFVNGVLRNLARSLDGLPWPEQGTVDHLALTTGHPAWIVRDLLDQHPHEVAAAILHADNDPPGLTLRAVADREEVMAELREAGLEPEATVHAPEGIRVPGADPRRLAAVQQGRAVPQDEASMLVVHACELQPGAKVIDLCAGPGGKTSHVASLAGPHGSVTAVEVHPHRADRVRAITDRLGQHVNVVVGDARTVDLPTGVDAILVDAPCTGLGVGRRRPEVRWRRTPKDADNLARLQRELVTRAIGLARPGGTVTYAVCTWTEQETTAVVTHLLTATPTLTLERQEQLLPSTHGTDGMFIAHFRLSSE